MALSVLVLLVLVAQAAAEPSGGSADNRPGKREATVMEPSADATFRLVAADSSPLAQPTTASVAANTTGTEGGGRRRYSDREGEEAPSPTVRYVRDYDNDNDDVNVDDNDDDDDDRHDDGGHRKKHKKGGKKKKKKPKKKKKGHHGFLSLLKKMKKHLPDIVHKMHGPSMFMMGMAQANFHNFVMHALMMSKMALISVIFMIVREMVFGDKDQPVKYYNFGYDHHRRRTIYASPDDYPHDYKRKRKRRRV